MDTSKYAWSAILTEEHTTIIDGKTVTHQHPITYGSGLFQGNHLNWDVLTKKAYALYIWQLSCLLIWQILVSLYKVTIFLFGRY